MGSRGRRASSGGGAGALQWAASRLPAGILRWRRGRSPAGDVRRERRSGAIGVGGGDLDVGMETAAVRGREGWIWAWEKRTGEKKKGKKGAPSPNRGQWSASRGGEQWGGLR